MAELSPAAQAVRNAAGRQYAIDGDLQDSIAAALRALTAGYSENLYDQNEGKVAVVRSDLALAIATELEGAS